MFLSLCSAILLEVLSSTGEIENISSLFGRYEHPLLVEKREKGDWVLPITVYAPPSRRRATHGRNDRSVLVGNLFNS